MSSFCGETGYMFRVGCFSIEAPCQHISCPSSTSIWFVADIDTVFPNTMSSIPSHSTSDAAVKALHISLTHVTTENMPTGYASGDPCHKMLRKAYNEGQGRYIHDLRVPGQWWKDKGGAKDRLIRHCRHFIDTHDKMGRFRAGLHSRASKVKLSLVPTFVEDVEIELACPCHMRVVFGEACGI
jgi:hypothetical protein